MKKIINGRFAAALFVASCIFWAGHMASCSNNTSAQAQAPASANTDSPTTAKAMLTCKTCAALTLSSTDTSGNPIVGPKLIFIGRTTEAIPANTDIQIEVVLGKNASTVGK